MLSDVDADAPEIMLIGMLYLLGIVAAALVIAMIAMLYAEAPQQFAVGSLLLLGAVVVIFGCGSLHVKYVRPWWQRR